MISDQTNHSVFRRTAFIECGKGLTDEIICVGEAAVVGPPHVRLVTVETLGRMEREGEREREREREIERVYYE